MAIRGSRRFVATFCAWALTSSSAYAIKELDVDGKLLSLKAEPLEAPSSSDKLYVYTKSPSLVVGFTVHGRNRYGIKKQV